MSSTEEYSIKMAHYQRGFETRLLQLAVKDMEWPERGMTKQAGPGWMPAAARAATPWLTRAMGWLGKKPGLVGTTLGAVGGGVAGGLGGAAYGSNATSQFYQSAIQKALEEKRKQMMGMGVWDRLGLASQFLFNPKSIADKIKYP